MSTPQHPWTPSGADPVGRPVPRFAGEAWMDGAFHHLDVETLRGRWVVLLFYPRDFSEDADAQLAAFAALQEPFEHRGVAIVALNRDSVYTHRAWTQTTAGLDGLRFALIEDAQERIAGELRLADAGAATSRCAVVLVDPAGLVRRIDASSSGRVDPHDVLREIDALVDGDLS